MQGAAEPDARLVKLTESPIAKASLLVENTLFRVAGDSGAQVLTATGYGEATDVLDMVREQLRRQATPE